mmetsp:Transcript_100353/g.259176  ORF Transcript_100353/g.259176 Transcript_100353/m.259176 type:complete len:109 (+) Transcript_100353:1-327(+)
MFTWGGTMPEAPQVPPPHLRYTSPPHLRHASPPHLRHASPPHLRKTIPVNGSGSMTLPVNGGSRMTMPVVNRGSSFNIPVGGGFGSPRPGMRYVQERSGPMAVHVLHR